MTAEADPVTITASSSSDRSSLRALFTPRLDELPGVASKVFVTEPAEHGESHWARVDWRVPRDIRGLTVVWPDGHAPRSFNPALRVDDAWVDLGDPAESDAERWSWRVAGACTGIRLEQPADGGHEKHPDVMRVRGVALQTDTPAEVALVLRGGDAVAIEMPVLTDWCGAAAVDVSDAHAVRLCHDASPLAGVELRISRLGDSGHPDDIRAWAASLDRVRVRTDDGWRHVEAGASVDASAAGRVCGIVALRVRLSEPSPCEEIEVDLPSRGGSILALAGIAVVDGQARDALSSVELGRDSGEGPASFALPLGSDGDGACFAVTATGLIEAKYSLPLRSRGRALLIRIDGGPLEPLRFAGEPGAVLTGDARAYALEPRVEDGRHVLAVEVPEFDRGISFSMVAADGHNPLASRWSESQSVVFCDGEAVLRADGRVRIRVDGAELRVQVHGNGFRVLGSPAEETVERAPALPGSIAALDPSVWSYVVELGRFREPDGRVHYGRYPSPYHGMIFGLEEDYAFFGAMSLGAEEFALEAFADTYLDPGHLDTDHYLHDLRHCLLPWQMWRLSRLAQRDVDSLFGEQGRAALHRCASWIRAARDRTAEAVGDVDEGGVRVFPGLLPPGRFGGDLDFRTQSLYLSAVAAVSLGALAELSDDDQERAVFAAESDTMSDAVQAAFEAVRSDEFVPLDTGGGEPGPYYQLAVGGVLHPVNFFADDDPLAAQMDAFLENDGRLSAGLPRFEAWGTAGPGDDAHYAIGYLLRCLRRGRVGRFREGLDALLHAGADDAIAFREVRPLSPQWGARAHLPERQLNRSEPCIGAVGAALVLLRHAWVAERFAQGWSPSGELLLFGGLGDAFWAADHEFDVTFPTLLGPLGLRAVSTAGGWSLQVEPPPDASVELAIPRSIVMYVDDACSGRRSHGAPLRLPMGPSNVRFERGAP